MQHPRWGKRRLREVLAREHSEPPSEATVGRWLAAFLAKCPVCGGRDGVHNEAKHVAQEVLGHYLPAVRLPRRPRRTSSRSEAVRAAERIVRGVGRKDQPDPK
jgi:hypothetical protein